MTDAPATPPEKAKPPRSNYDSLRESTPGNANKQRKVASETPAAEPDKKGISPVTQAVERKPTLGKKIKQSLTGDDSRTVGNYILFEVVIPAFKQLVSDGVSTAIERLLFGGGSAGGGGVGARRGYTPYNRYATTTKPTIVTTVKTSGTVVGQPDPRAVHNFDHILLESRGVAEEIIDQLNEIIKSYGAATVADFYQLVNMSPGYNDENWGWDSMVGARAVRVGEGYILAFPRTRPLE